MTLTETRKQTKVNYTLLWPHNHISDKRNEYPSKEKSTLPVADFVTG
jgi:hypothetical protein